MQEELRKQLQQSLVESDNQRELCRRLHAHEIQIKQLKSANYSYKAQVGCFITLMALRIRKLLVWLGFFLKLKLWEAMAKIGPN
jgi:hypothetical protein